MLLYSHDKPTKQVGYIGDCNETDVFNQYLQRTNVLMVS